MMTVMMMGVFEMVEDSIMVRERREDKIGCEKKMWGDRGSKNTGPAKLMPV
jgi:hypothetical protein